MTPPRKTTPTPPSVAEQVRRAIRARTPSRKMRRAEQIAAARAARDARRQTFRS